MGTKNLVLGVVVFAYLAAIVVPLTLFATSHARAEETPQTYHHYVSESGTLSFTNNVDRIPAAYKDAAVVKKFDPTVPNPRHTPGEVYEFVPARERLKARLDLLQSAASDQSTYRAADPCAGSVTVRQERRDYRERGQQRNSLFYVVVDHCGNERSATRSDPRALIVPGHPDIK